MIISQQKLSYSIATQKNAFIVSALTHPMLMPVIGFLFLNKSYALSFQGQSFYVLLGIFSVCSILLPGYFVFALKRSGYIQSYEMETITERKLPLLFTCAALVFNYYLMQRANLPQPFTLYFLSTCLASLSALLISLFYKISLHTLGIGFIFGLGLCISRISPFDIRYFLILTVLVGGIISFCRLVLMAHTLPQIYLGFLVGCLCSAAPLLFL